MAASSTGRFVMTVPTTPPPAAAAPVSVVADWAPIEPLPSHLEPDGDGLILLRTGQCVTDDAIPQTDLAGMQRRMDAAWDTLHRMDPIIDQMDGLTWQGLLMARARAATRCSLVLDAWDEQQVWFRTGAAWFSLEECLVGLHRAPSNQTGLRRETWQGRTVWVGRGSLWTQAQLDAAQQLHAAAPWTTRILRRLVRH